MPRPKIIKLSNKNQDALDKFITHIKAHKDIKQPTVNTYFFCVQRVLNLIDKDYDKITNSDLDLVFSKIEGTSCALTKMKFKEFLKYLNLNELADTISISYKAFKKETKTFDDCLRKEEIQTFINTAFELRDKAIVETYIVTGGRRQEIALLKIGDIEIDKSTIWITINNSKTKHRKVPIVAIPDHPTAIYPKHLISWLETHPYKSDPTKPLFYSLSTRTKGEPLSVGSINGIIKKIAEKSGIKRKISPHIIRHTSATYDGSILNEQQMCLKYGWTKGSEMVSRYSHQEPQHLAEQLQKIAGLTPEIIEKESICPRCKEPNHINAEKCSKCHYILDKELLMKSVEEQKSRENILIEKINDYDRRMNELENNNNQVKTLVERLIYDGISPFHGPNLTPEMERFEEEIEDKALRENNERVKERYNKLIKEGENVELTNIDGRLFISTITEKLERFRKLLKILNVRENEAEDKEEWRKAKTEMLKFINGSIKSFTAEEQNLFHKFKELQEFNPVSFRQLRKDKSKYFDNE